MKSGVLVVWLRHTSFGGTHTIFSKFSFAHPPPPPSRETFQGQKTLFVLYLQESLANLNSLPHQFEIASGAAADKA